MNKIMSWMAGEDGEWITVWGTHDHSMVASKALEAWKEAAGDEPYPGAWEVRHYWGRTDLMGLEEWPETMYSRQPTEKNTLPFTVLFLNDYWL